MPKSHAEVQDLPDGYRMTELGPLPVEWGSDAAEGVDNYEAQEA